MFRPFTILFFIISANSALAGQSYQSLEEIRQAALDFATANLPSHPDQRMETEVGYIDKRLRLARCDQNLSTERLSGTRNIGNTTVTVKCQGAVQWAIHVPVTIKAYTPVVVATQPLARNIKVSKDQLRIEEREVSMLRSGYFSKLEDVLGRIPKRTINSGSAISKLDLDTTKVVLKGHKVIIMAQTPGISVRMRGKALDDGARGDVVTVQNLSSMRKIEAVVLEPGVVSVPM